MDWKEKYEEALERAKRYLEEENYTEMADVFPELAESEDERIRKIIIKAVNIAASADGGLLHHEAQQCLEWLENKKDTNCLACDQHLKGYLAGRKVTEEKQKEHPMPDSTQLIEWWDEEEAMLKEKDFRDDTWRIAQNAFIDGVFYGWRIKQKEQKVLPGFDDWTPEENLPAGFYYIDKDGNKYYSKEFRYGDMKVKVGEQKPAWSEEDEKILVAISKALGCDTAEKILENEGVTLLMAAGFLASLRPQPKQEWTEEEKQKLNRIYSIIGWAMDEHAFCSCKKLIGDKEGVELQDFLRSIAKPEPQPHWKPSEEDEKCLQELMQHIEHCVTVYGASEPKWQQWLNLLKFLRPQQNQEWKHYIWAYNLKFNEDALVIYEDNGECELVRQGNKPRRNVSGRYVLIKDVYPQPRWKPSEEQMNSLSYGIYVLEGEGYDAAAREIKELFDQLKKLKEE